jgi:phosphoenolpyruvate---glycerone phosphotransferase subunit DhaL
VSADGAGLAALLGAVLADLEGSRDELNRIDGIAGDGDLGITVAGASLAVRELLPAIGTLPLPEALRRVGLEIARRAPSTAGTLVAFAFLAAAKVEPAPGAGAGETAAALLDAAERSVRERGRVGPGDRTMLDALAPAAVAFRATIEAGDGEAAAAAAAARAASAGAAATSAMEATVGRAGWLRERAQGHPDAGAVLVALAFEAASRALAGRG